MPLRSPGQAHAPPIICLAQVYGVLSLVVCVRSTRSGTVDERRLPLIAAILIGISTRAFAVSVFTRRPDDPAAVYLTAQEFGVRGDGTTDDSAAIQAAIDKATATPNGGIVFVPAGRYRLTRTIYVWRGVRVIGYGATRPVFVLADNTPGFQKGIGLMVMFTSAGRPGCWSTSRQHSRAVSAARQRPGRTTRFPTPVRAPSIRR